MTTVPFASNCCSTGSTPGTTGFNIPQNTPAGHYPAGAWPTPFAQPFFGTGPFTPFIGQPSFIGQSPIAQWPQTGPFIPNSPFNGQFNPYTQTPSGQFSPYAGQFINPWTSQFGSPFVNQFGSPWATPFINQFATPWTNQFAGQTGSPWFNQFGPAVTPGYSNWPSNWTPSFGPQTPWPWHSPFNTPTNFGTPTNLGIPTNFGIPMGFNNPTSFGIPAGYNTPANFGFPAGYNTPTFPFSQNFIPGAWAGPIATPVGFQSPVGFPANVNGSPFPHPSADHKNPGINREAA